MAKVMLHIYDVANGSEKTNKTIVRINNILYGLGLGGIFHSAVQVYGDDEWSFGFSEEEDSGVFRSPAGKNTMYKYRKSLVLGKTNLNFFEVRQILRELSREWSGDSYDLLSKNCNHFCDELCARLGVPKLPGWVNRFANAGDVAREGAENTVSRFRKAKTNIVSASKVAFRFLSGVTNNVKTHDLNSPTNSSIGGSPTPQAAWFRNLSTKSSSKRNKI
ncbi:DeSI-like protein, partial [Mucuna pruriens]